MDKHKCPACESDSVCVGNFVLRCEACGWSYLNSHPCRVCGKPATGVMGNGQAALYSCSTHPFTEEEMRAVWHGLIQALASPPPPPTMPTFV